MYIVKYCIGCLAIKRKHTLFEFGCVFDKVIIFTRIFILKQAESQLRMFMNYNIYNSILHPFDPLISLRYEGNLVAV
jgi:hypothetical protein